jgi:hypothetical protein
MEVSDDVEDAAVAGTEEPKTVAADAAPTAADEAAASTVTSEGGANVPVHDGGKYPMTPAVRRILKVCTGRTPLSDRKSVLFALSDLIPMLNIPHLPILSIPHLPCRPT